MAFNLNNRQGHLQTISNLYEIDTKIECSCFELPIRIPCCITPPVYIRSVYVQVVITFTSQRSSNNSSCANAPSSVVFNEQN